jgi:hypothetical protein
METLAEQVVGACLVQTGTVFVSPGHNIDNGRTFTDFVVLAFSRCEVSVVEVTTAIKLRHYWKAHEGRRAQRQAVSKRVNSSRAADDDPRIDSLTEHSI